MPLRAREPMIFRQGGSPQPQAADNNQRFDPIEDVRMRMKRASLITRIAATLSLTVVGPISADAAPTLRDGSHDMDFSIGHWRTDITSFKDPFGHPDDATHMSGTKTARPVWNGKAVLEEIEADGPDGHWEAANLYLYDPKAHQWSQNYVDSETGRFAGTPGTGELREGKFELYWQATIQGRALLERGTWSDFAPNSHSYRIERSNDGGRTWHSSFIARLTRIP